MKWKWKVWHKTQDILTFFVSMFLNLQGVVESPVVDAAADFCKFENREEIEKKNQITAKVESVFLFHQQPFKIISLVNLKSFFFFCLQYLQKLNLWCTTTFNAVQEFIWRKFYYSNVLLTPMIAFNSGIVTCFALSTACATCCWCSAARNGKSCPISAFSLFAISVCNENKFKV